MITENSSDKKKIIQVAKIPGFNSGNIRIPSINSRAIPSFNHLHLVMENEELENSPMRNKGSQQEI